MDPPPGHPQHPGVARHLRLSPVVQAQGPMVSLTAPLEILVQALQAPAAWAQVAPLQCQVLVL